MKSKVNKTAKSAKKKVSKTAKKATTLANTSMSRITKAIKSLYRDIKGLRKYRIIIVKM